MTEPRRRTTTLTREDRPRPAPGPGTDPGRVFEAYERDGHADPGEAWASFTAAWNWASPLPHAVPRHGPDGPPVARPVPGGYALSGRWHLPADTAAGPWLALPLTAPWDTAREARENATESRPDRPDVFVVASRVLPRQATGGLRAVRSAAGPDTEFRLDGVHVPTGFTTHSSGTALSARDGGFLWTAVTGMALGAASRLTDELAVLGPSPVAGPAVSPAAAAAELSGLLSGERLGFTAELYNRPGLGQLISLAAREPLADRVRRAARLVHHVVTASYERAIPFPTDSGHNPLAALVTDSAAILHHLRFTVDVRPAEDTGSRTGR
ncbi:hypothetical protein ACJ6WF_44925 [Streptomyces sp. MMS24-I2-30]|uniref:hypothetical protein n=1 Tax=Streptomyces sp. MMS24-I2-30 TaxID=3351564 RepID=UPI003896E908